MSAFSSPLRTDALFTAGKASPASIDGDEITFTASLLHKKPLPGMLYFEFFMLDSKIGLC